MAEVNHELTGSSSWVYKMLTEPLGLREHQMKSPRRSAAEIIAFHFCSDISEVRDMIYQPTRYRNPYVYCWGEDYFCCPTDRQKPPKDPDFADTFDWKVEATHYGRTIYRSKAGQEV